MVRITTHRGPTRLGGSRFSPAENRTLFLVFMDEDKKLFNVVGPMTDEGDWNKKIVELQKSGRHVRYVSITNEHTAPAIGALYSRQTGFTYSAALLVEPPFDESSAYRGRLPKYAERADRKRLVRLFCKGKCNATRWAEMTVDYPGQEVLTRFHVLDLTATCLVCGRKAHDSYNWYR